MISKLSNKNQITIPEEILEKFPAVEYFEISYEDEVIILRPIRKGPIELKHIREKIKKLGLNKETIKEAITWARKE